MRCNHFDRSRVVHNPTRNDFFSFLTFSGIKMLWTIYEYLDLYVFSLFNVLFNFKRDMNFLEVLGILAIVFFAWKILLTSAKCVYHYCIKATIRRNVLLKHKGSWAVVTGASDGIGKAYANILGAMGINIVLISRDIKKLNPCAADIEAKHNVQTKVIPVDFSKGIEIYEEIERNLNGLDIGVLVNNVGISYSYPEKFLDVPEKEKLFSAMIRTNVVSVTKMCEIVMPRMLEKKSGVIINVSSASAIIPSPYLTVYGATKAYVTKFSDELRNEYKSEGITIQTVMPGFVATKMSKIRNSSWLAPTADRFVQSAIAKVGIFDHTTGYFPHTIFVNTLLAIFNLCPPFYMRMVKKSMKRNRDRALAKLRRKTTEE